MRQAAVGDLMGVSRERVRQLEESALQKLGKSGVRLRIYREASGE